ncbi:group III truncated hemoglobin [Kitasatospora sp. NBC_01250]|uniref:group III truncated hemoglobin n=1 Tax=unclassified Kitasatospora TaxID=2633591 RepID=UPI002E0DF607|nr:MULTISPECIES: group III truncated hemoglobin [unclassified Kitasatospora]WSJ66217.1 group III truncated hemoglobin [Kitasatospora sp. NBC_01302]
MPHPDAAGSGAAEPDIATRSDLEHLLRRFYAAAFADPLIGPHFTEVARMDLAAHLPRITDFWESALLRSAAYRRNAFAPHAALHEREPLTAAHFGRWVQLWSAAVDGLHRGPLADRAKAQGERIALAMLRRTSGEDPATGGPGGFVPLSAVLLRSPG